jgi:hypothetical protein
MRPERRRKWNFSISEYLNAQIGYGELERPRLLKLAPLALQGDGGRSAAADAIRRSACRRPAAAALVLVSRLAPIFNQEPLRSLRSFAQ